MWSHPCQRLTDKLSPKWSPIGWNFRLSLKNKRLSTRQTLQTCSLTGYAPRYELDLIVRAMEGCQQTRGACHCKNRVSGASGSWQQIVNFREPRWSLMVVSISMASWFEITIVLWCVIHGFLWQDVLGTCTRLACEATALYMSRCTLATWTQVRR